MYRFGDVRQFDNGEEVLWIRHDVELSLEAALQVAQIENEMGIASSYFLCPESPALSERGAHAIRGAARVLRDLGHTVSLHLVVAPSFDGIELRVERYTALFDLLDTAFISFHAPGIDAEILASLPGGKAVYTRMANRTCSYFSDSTGRWRHGHPTERSIAGSAPVQLLIHPYWWSLGLSGVMLQEVPGLHAFLPQLTEFRLRDGSSATGIVAARSGSLSLKGGEK
jgi:hypothetical protein